MRLLTIQEALDRIDELISLTDELFGESTVRGGKLIEQICSLRIFVFTANEDSIIFLTNIIEDEIEGDVLLHVLALKAPKNTTIDAWRNGFEELKEYAKQLKCNGLSFSVQSDRDIVRFRKLLPINYVLHTGVCKWLS